MYIKNCQKRLSEFVNGFLGEFLELHTTDRVCVSIAVFFSMIFIFALAANLENIYPVSWFAVVLPHWFGNLMVLIWLAFVAKRRYHKKLLSAQLPQSALMGELLFIGFFTLIFTIIILFEGFICMKLENQFGENSWWVVLIPLFLITVPLAIASLILLLSAIVSKIKKKRSNDDLIFGALAVLFCCGILGIQVLLAMRLEGQFQVPYWFMFLGLECSFVLVSYQVYHNSTNNKGEYWEKRVLKLEE